MAQVLAEVCYSMCVLTWKRFTREHTFSHLLVGSHLTEQVHARQFFSPSSPDQLSGCSCFHPFYWSTLITFQISYRRHLAEDLIRSTYNERNSRLSFHVWIIHHLKNTSYSYKFNASLNIKTKCGSSLGIADVLKDLLTHNYDTVSDWILYFSQIMLRFSQIAVIL